MHISFKLFISAAVIDTFSAPNNRRHASATICHSRPLVATVTGVWRGEEGANRKGTFVTAIASRHNPTCPLPLSLCLSLSLSLFHKDWIFDKPALTVFYWPSKSLSLSLHFHSHTHTRTHTLQLSGCEYSSQFSGAASVRAVGWIAVRGCRKEQLRNESAAGTPGDNDRGD